MYETRVFVLWGEDIDEGDKSKVSISNGNVSFDLFPGEAITVAPDVEERTDFYVHLGEVENASEIGLKCRGGKKPSIELKTVLHQAEDDDNKNLDFWIKSRQRGNFDPRDPKSIIEFLRGCLGPQKEHSERAIRHLEKIADEDTSLLTLIEVSKARRTGFFRQGSIIIEETDMSLRLESSPNEIGSKAPHKTLFARSWAAEASNNGSLLRTIARNWDERVRQLLLQKLGEKASQCQVVVASYPGIALHAANLLH